eukprot:CAMPEP_0172590468 /NCGR_PEP_ID=MMETSP1068-20121228/8989_1 /TAXON_ID=35684 /ORGANISM="Pseudopedinella elastica, Strain CCMP716" /LENGTH=195 /DNA_ID=CAMNT_0013386367 /DNA_START=198 /DNA_END=785 /DNA_ORIENTATION=+
MCQGGRWTPDEHELFVKGMSLYGRRWTKVAEVVGTRTTVQVRSHAQKWEMKTRKDVHKFSRGADHRDRQPLRTSHSLTAPENYNNESSDYSAEDEDPAPGVRREYGVVSMPTALPTALSPVSRSRDSESVYGSRAGESLGSHGFLDLLAFAAKTLDSAPERNPQNEPRSFFEHARRSPSSLDSSGGYRAGFVFNS